MIAYFEKGHLDGTARDVARRRRSVSFELKDGSVEWYRVTGKKVALKTNAKKDDGDRLTARVFRYSNTVKAAM